LTCNVGEPAIDAARAGVGIVMALAYQVAEDLGAGRLIRVLQAFELPPLPVHALYQSPRLMAVRVRVFLDLLTLRIPQRLQDAMRPAEPATPRGRGKRRS
jgi:DNA-binding transcriptional LysR family regulator